MKRLFWRLAIVLTCLFLILPMQPALATDWRLAQAPPSIDSLRQQQQQIEQQRSNLNRQRDQLQNLERSAQERLGGLQDVIKTTASQIEQNQKQLDLANQRLATLQSDLAKAEAAYQQRQFSTVARLRFLQRQQGSRGWAVLLQSRSLNDFIDRRRQLKLVYEADRTSLAGLKAESDELNRRRRLVERQKNEIALLTEQLLAQKSEYQAQAEAQQTLITRLRQDSKALEEAESQLAQDSENVGNLIRQRLNESRRSRIVVRGTGQFSLPSDGSITSGFGYRVHPILGYRRFHAGIDFGAGYGSTIRAADSGVVIFSGWYGGYGKSVIIDHGDNVTTMYAHSSEVYVSEGQTVQRGQPIAAIGSTGLSTGPHLHFEVRVNGNPVNPLDYL